MISVEKQEELALLKMGIKAGNLKEDIFKIIKNNPVLKQDFEKVKTSLKTMTDEDQYLDVITKTHRQIAQISENSKIIITRDNTFCIRAINPDNIQSLTQRAFFNSFNLQRNDMFQDEQQQSQEFNKADPEGKSMGVGQNEDPNINKKQDNCICDKIIPGAVWVQCSNESKCRGSVWYHLACSGLQAQQDQEALVDKQFTCQYCKREVNDEEEHESQSQKKVKK